jgi:hypothetical protein
VKQSAASPGAASMFDVVYAERRVQPFNSKSGSLTVANLLDSVNPASIALEVKIDPKVLTFLSL